MAVYEDGGIVGGAIGAYPCDSQELLEVLEVNPEYEVEGQIGSEGDCFLYYIPEGGFYNKNTPYDIKTGSVDSTSNSFLPNNEELTEIKEQLQILESQLHKQNQINESMFIIGLATILVLIFLLVYFIKKNNK